MSDDLLVTGYRLQEEPEIWIAAVPGKWLFKHSTTSWRAEDPELGFQRMVREDRAKEIATNVLSQSRTFPNAIVLATDRKGFSESGCKVRLPSRIKFLVVDGQHRLYAQKYCEAEALYACAIHTGLDEEAMARLFLEINDTQRRVPSSLRWDLVRLVRRDVKPDVLEAAELVYELATDRESPLFQRIDLTGEQGRIRIKQGSIAPELKFIVGNRKSSLREETFDTHYEILKRYLVAISELDTDGWRDGSSPLSKPRVLRAMLRVLPEIVEFLERPPLEIRTVEFIRLLKKIRLSELEAEKIKAVQGSAGIRQIVNQLREELGLSNDDGAS